MRGRTLGEIINMVREEAGQSSNAAAGRNITDILRQYVRRTYERLHQDFNWPHLYQYDDIFLEAGKRYYAFPDDLDPDRLGEVHSLEAGGDCWRDVEYGVGPIERNRYRHEDGEYCDRVLKWDRAPQAGENFIEVWPTPEVDGQVLRFQGMPKPELPAGDSDKVNLDASLVALFAAGEWLAKQNSADAQLKLEQARAMYDRIRSNISRADPFFKLNPRRGEKAYRPITVRAPGT